MSNCSHPLSTNQVNCLYDACDDTMLGRRDYVMLVLLFNCGLSLRELANLQRRYVDLDAGWLWAVEGFSDPRPVPINRRAADALAHWLSRRDARNLRYVIGRLPDCRNKISARALKNRIDVIAAQSGISFAGDQGAATLAQELYRQDPAAHGPALPQPPALQALLPFSELQDLARRETMQIPQPAALRPIPAPSPALQQGRSLLDRVGERL